MSEVKLCECGCLRPAPIAKQTNTKQGVKKGEPQRFVHGHHNRVMSAEARAKAAAKVRERHPPGPPPNPSGLCMCGCEEITSISKENDRRRGAVAGEHVRYVKGHSQRMYKHTEATRAKMRANHVSTSKGKFQEEAYAWKRGWWIDNCGYKVLFRPNHPMANSRGGVPEHRLIMAEHLGRMLTPEEVVHHKTVEEGGTNDKADNRIENLILFASNSEHMRHHAWLRRVARQAA